MTEEAEAAKEIAKASAPLLQTASELLRGLLAKSAVAIGDTLEDQLRYLQWSNRLRILKKAALKIEQRGLGGKLLPPAFLMPAVEASGHVEDPDLQELWAELIANGAASEENRRRMFVDTLARMAAEDAKVFAAEVQNYSPPLRRKRPTRFPFVIDDSTRERLEALRLLEVRIVDASAPAMFRTADVDKRLKRLEDLARNARTSRVMTISGYGWQFARAVGLMRAAPEQPKENGNASEGS
jgi:hypothetical protein